MEDFTPSEDSRDNQDTDSSFSSSFCSDSLLEGQGEHITPKYWNQASPASRSHRRRIRRRPVKRRRSGNSEQFSTIITHKSSQNTQNPQSPRQSGQSEKDSSVTADSTGAGLVFAGVQFMRDVLSKLLWMVRTPLTWGIAIYLFALLVWFAGIYVRSSIMTALSPICAIPGVGGLGLPFCDGRTWGRSTRDGMMGGYGDENLRAGGKNFPKLVNLQTEFEGVLENSVGGSVMAIDLKNSEIAVRDLNSLVKSSGLLCKETLSARLENFVLGAKSTSRALTRFSSRVGGVVDTLVAMDEFAIRALENVQAMEISSSRPSYSSSLVSFDTLRHYFLALFQSPSDRANAERAVLQAFAQASSVMDVNIRRLIIEAEVVLKDLEDLENKLHVIEDIVQEEGVVIDMQHREVLGEIWTWLGGNRAKLDSFLNHRFLLENVSVYRKKALSHVSASLVMLMNMQANLDELRERVAKPGLEMDVGGGMAEIGGEKVPLEVHIQSIRKGVERLSDGMAKAKEKENTYMMKMIAVHDEAIRNLNNPRMQ